MNDHPEELLADYVERTLGEEERAQVESHLATCEQCRDEIELAAGARAALLSLPEVDPAPDIPLRVKRGTRKLPSTREPSRAVRVLAAAGVAAAVIAGGVFVVSNLKSGDQDQTAAESGAESAPEGSADGGAGVAATDSEPSQDQAEAQAGSPAKSAFAAPPVIPTYLETENSYTGEDLSRYARDLRDDVRSALDAGIAPTATEFFSDFDLDAFPSKVRSAIGCVLADVPPSQPVTPFQIEAATFDGVPAYIAVFLQGPTPEDPYDRMVIWVVDRSSCTLISLASQVL